MSAYCSKARIPDYYVCMIERSRGCEAIVDPEITLREVIDRIMNGDYPAARIRFIHHVTEDGVTDVTDEIVPRCRQYIASHAACGTDYEAMRLAAKFDHERDLRKHEVPA